VSGFVEERLLGSSADTQGMQVVSDLENFSGSGTGTLNGDFVLLNGSIMLSGKGSVPKDTF
jgi:hypothetical protein